MSKIHYKLYEGAFLAVDITDSNEGELEISFDESFDGSVIIGNTTVEIRDQKCPINLNTLEDGLHLPLVIKDKTGFYAEGFCKRGNVVELAPLTWSDFRKMRDRQHELEKEISTLRDSVRELSDTISHTTIF